MCSKCRGYSYPGLIFLSAIIISALMAGCSTSSALGSRSFPADRLADKAGFNKEYIEAGNFELLTYRKVTRPGKTVRIYIEGDGNAWATKRRLSDDPTPRHPVALFLAAEDPSDNVVYIARPGQFPKSASAHCDPTYWSARRSSPEVVDAFCKAIDKIKIASGASSVELVGYSGGGAIAVLVAARRNDITTIRTVAGNLDHKALCGYHHVSDLEGSLNPIDHAAEVKDIPQRHFVGSKDTVVTEFIARSFVEREGDKNYDRVTMVEGATHTKGWQERWKKLLSL